MTFLETYFLMFIGTYAVQQVWNTEKWTQTKIFTNSLLWTGFWIVFDRFFCI
jgi:hypothetical protein